MSENKKKPEEGITRKDFLKLAGITGLTAGMVGSSSIINPARALAGEDTGRPIVDFAIKEVDDPPYRKDPYSGADNLERYNHNINPFVNNDLAKKEFDGKPWFAAMEETTMKLLQQNNTPPGFTLVDQTLANISWTSYRTPALFSWEPLGVAMMHRWQQLGKWDGSPEDNNKIVKKAGQLFGAGQTGVTKLNPQWVYDRSEGSYENDGVPIIISDQHDKPVKTEEARYIPESMNNVVVMVVPMYKPLDKYSPSALASAAVGRGYSLMAECVSKMAEFIRGLGYNAIPMGNDTALSLPLAIDAGLGELGRHGLLINPVYGSWLRVCKVFTDMPIVPDKPIDFGAAKFCRDCMKCAELCPSGSISLDREPSTEVKCPSNNPGMKKWYVNTWTCLSFWVQNGTDCSVCQAVCPYNKPQTWIHDLVKGVSSRTTVFNGSFSTMDDMLGYGTTVEDNNPNVKWWEADL